LGAVAGLFVVFVGPWHETWIDALARTPAWPSAAASRSEPLPVVSGPLHVGVATVEVTDLCGKACLAGYGKRAFKPNSGRADALRVRALVIKNGMRKSAVVSGDLLLVNRRLADAVYAELIRDHPDWQRDELYFGATHTHSGPGGYTGRTLEAIGMGWRDEEFANALAVRMAETIAAADKQAESAEWRRIAVQAPENAVANRTRAGGPTNRWLDCVEFRRPGEDRLLTSLVAFGAHATCRPSDDDRLSGDYPGALADLAQRQFGGACVFLAGGVGSQAPGALGNRDRRDRELAQALVDAWQTARRSAPTWRSEIALTTVRRRIELPPPAVKISRDWRVSPILAGFLLPTHTEIHGLRLGDAVFVGAPADFGGPLAEPLRSAAPNCTTVVTSFAGDYVGYVIDDADYDLPKYEPRQMVFYGRSLGKRFSDEVARLAKEIGR
jgi:hypothetical protein